MNQVLIQEIHYFYIYELTQKTELASHRGLCPFLGSVQTLTTSSRDSGPFPSMLSRLLPRAPSSSTLSKSYHSAMLALLIAYLCSLACSRRAKAVAQLFSRTRSTLGPSEGFIFAWAGVQEAPAPSTASFRCPRHAGKAGLARSLLLPSRLFCLSSLATRLEYACAEDSSRMGGGGTCLLRQPLPVCKHPAHVDLAWYCGSKSN